MYKYQFSIFFLACSLFIACKEIDQTKFQGTWKVASLMERGVAKDMDFSNYEFEFRPDGTYHFNGSQGQVEAGRYRTVEDILYATDTTHTGSLEKPVRVVGLTQDSMNFEMNNGGIEQVFKLYRSK